MEAKKHPEYELDRHRPLFFFIGLIVAILCIISAFEWKSPYEPIDITRSEIIEEPPIFVPLTDQKEPEPPKPQIKKQMVTSPSTEVMEIKDDLPEKNDENTFNPADLIEEIIPPAPPVETPPEYNGLVESPATYPGGWDAFNRYIAENISFPRRAKSIGVDGKVFVQFTINTDGTITDIQVVKGIGLGCDDEALRVLQSIPERFNPAKNRGREVRVKMILPIYFKTR